MYMYSHPCIFTHIHVHVHNYYYTCVYNIVDMVYMYMYNLLTSLFEEVLDSL